MVLSPCAERAAAGESAKQHPRLRPENTAAPYTARRSKGVEAMANPAREGLLRSAALVLVARALLPEAAKKGNSFAPSIVSFALRLEGAPTSAERP